MKKKVEHAPQINVKIVRHFIKEMVISKGLASNVVITQGP
jgi:hypothetical protein